MGCPQPLYTGDCMAQLASQHPIKQKETSQRRKRGFGWTGRSALHDMDFLRTASDSTLEYRPSFAFETITQTSYLGRIGLTGFWPAIMMLYQCFGATASQRYVRRHQAGICKSTGFASSKTCSKSSILCNSAPMGLMKWAPNWGTSSGRRL